MSRVTGGFVVAMLGVVGGIGSDAAGRQPHFGAPSQNGVEAGFGEEEPLDQKAQRVDIGQAVKPLAASSRTSVHDEVIVATGRWSVSHATNMEGSFSFVRNTSKPSPTAETVRASLGDGEEHELEARQTRVWDCDSIADGAQLAIATGSGVVIYNAPINCGDAVYVRPATPE